MENSSLISIIMPAYNSEKFVAESIRSVLEQEHPHFELIIINDGSTDNTLAKIHEISDSRIQVISQANQGVSAARNRGLALMNGDYFCFLDSDDLMTKNSLTSRLAIFSRNPEGSFVGGGQEQRSSDLSEMLLLQIPTFEGYPQRELARLNPGCFINCGCWLIKRDPEVNYQFPLGWTHCEDLAFFFSISEGKRLFKTSEIVQIYRRSNHTAMSNLEGLELGYWKFYKMVGITKACSIEDIQYLKRRIIRIMALSYIRAGEVVSTWKILTKII